MRYPAAKFATLPALCLVLGLTACNPAGKDVTDDYSEALSRIGYTQPPMITRVTQQGARLVIEGRATPDGRVRLIYSGLKNGLPVDSKGRFRFEVTAGPVGGIYDLQMEDGARLPATDDRGRFLNAEGRVFVPTGFPDKAVTLRPGGASLPLGDERLVMAVIDYDGAGGLAVAGRVEAGQIVNLLEGDVIIGRAQSDDTGRYHLTSQIPAPTETPYQLTLTIQAGSDHEQRTVTVSKATGKDQIARLPEGWRVDWTLPGDGEQTTLIF